jgi:hypothetical protein
MIARFTGLVIFSFCLSAWYSLEICGAATFDEPDAMEKHKKNVADAVLDVSKAMALEISKSIQQKDYLQAEKLSLSLESFLTSENHPASLITDPRIAQSYIAKRKESAREVYQQYQSLLSKTPRGAYSVNSEMDAFVAMETELQMIPAISDPSTDASSSKPLSTPPSFDLPSRKSPAPRAPPPSSKAPTTPKSSQKGNAKSKVLDAEKLNEWNEKIAAIKEEYDRKFANATTDLQRQKVAQANKPEAIKRCLKLIDETHIEVRCKLLNSHSTDDSNFPYRISYEVIDSSIEFSFKPTLLNVAGKYQSIADAPSGTRFKVKIPVVAVENTSKGEEVVDTLSKNSRLTIADRNAAELPGLSFMRFANRFLSLPCQDPLLALRSSQEGPSETELAVFLYAMLPAAYLELDNEP